MRRIFLFLLTTVLLVSGACAEGILPPVSTAPPIVDVETISLDAVLGAISGGIGKEKTADGGLLYGGGWHFLGVQCLGIAVIDLWAAVCGVLLFFGIKKAHGLRVEARVEDEGLDIYEHGESCYN